MFIITFDLLNRKKKFEAREKGSKYDATNGRYLYGSRMRKAEEQFLHVNSNLNLLKS